MGKLKRSPVYTAHQLLAFTKANPVKEEEEQAPKVEKMRQAGSIPSTGIAPERIDRWMEVARSLLPADVHVGNNAHNRLVVTSEDVGITCALLEFVGKHMNDDGTLPWARTKGLWDCLYERGVIRRSFNAKRFAWIRRMLNGAGLVDIQDPTYVVGERAAKWSPSEKFWSLASSLNTKEGEGGQYLAETGISGNAQDWWEKGIPLVQVGMRTKEREERRRIEELVEAIISPSSWGIAA